MLYIHAICHHGHILLHACIDERRRLHSLVRPKEISAFFLGKDWFFPEPRLRRAKLKFKTMFNIEGGEARANSKISYIFVAIWGFSSSYDLQRRLRRAKLDRKITYRFLTLGISYFRSFEAVDHAVNAETPRIFITVSYFRVDLTLGRPPVPSFHFFHCMDFERNWRLYEKFGFLPLYIPLSSQN